MPKQDVNEEETEEIEYEEGVKFGYGASVVFLVFIVFVIYISWGK